MIFAGIDVGSLTAEAVLLRNGNLLAHATMSVLPNPVDSARAVLGRALNEAHASPNDIRYAISTGYGREKIVAAGLAWENVSEISCHGYGAHCLAPSVRTVIDIGGQDAKVIRLTPDGELLDFVMNDKCAAGTGHFLELMCRALDVTLDELGPLALQSRQPAEMSNRCSIYVETEVIHYLQRGVPKVDVAGGINRSMAERVLALVRRVQWESEVMLTGGVAKNPAVKAELEKMLGVRMRPVKIDPQIIGAYGAARLAQRKGGAS